MDPEVLLTALVLLPGLAFLLFGACWLFGVRLTEKFVRVVSAGVYVSATVLVAALAIVAPACTTVSAVWFAVGNYHFALSLLLDSLSLPFVGLTVILTGIISAFSARYLHREAGFFRFFVLLHLFAFGSLLLFTAGSLDLLLGGWELLGITSVMLIGFFQDRPSPLQNGLRVFGIYRTADVGLLLAIVALHHFAGTTTFTELFQGEWPRYVSVLHGREAMLVGILLLFAACGKSAQGPFSSWLPRAMEGPTPSSAIFYGAISIHAGCYMLLRFYPLLSDSALVMGAIAATGVFTALMGTMVGRSCTDAKGILAYASLSQVGLIFFEIGIGFPTLALWHASGHAVVRTLQFLRAPSALHEFHQMHASAGGNLEQPGTYYSLLVPTSLRRWFYRLALERGYLDALLDRFVVVPLRNVGQVLLMVESHLTSAPTRRPTPDSQRIPAGSRPTRSTLTGEVDA